VPQQAIPQHRACTVCGERVGVYEPAVFALRDGTIVRTSPTNLAGVRDEIARVWHAGCHAAA
jgi:hypothetical protein